MPPRLPIRSLTAAFSSIPSASTPITSFVLPILSQTRYASILSDLRDLPAAHTNKVRVGRGPSSRKGGKSGRGHKGQKQKGKAPSNFNGGQTPDEQVHGKFGFTNAAHKVEMSEINLDKIQDWIDQGRLDATKPITLKELNKSGACTRVKDGIKLLARGSEMLKVPVHIVVSRASQSAIKAVEAVGGTVTTRFYTAAAIGRIRRGLMHPYISLRWDQSAIGIQALEHIDASTPELRVKGVGYQYRLPDPTGRSDIEYYRNKDNRGYLAHTVPEGHSPSLFYKSPVQIEEDLVREKAAAAARVGTSADLRSAENSVW
jgi:large subunit ribosomal protein L15